MRGPLSPYGPEFLVASFHGCPGDAMGDFFAARGFFDAVAGTAPHASRTIQRALRWFTWALAISTATAALCRISWIYPVVFTFPVEESAFKVFTMNSWSHLRWRMVMSLQSDNQATTTRKSKRAGKRLGNGEVYDAQHDADVIHMVSAEVDKRAAAIHAMIADAAYFRAEKRGFEAGHELEDWLAAEEEIEQHLEQQDSAAHLSESRSES